MTMTQTATAVQEARPPFAVAVEDLLVEARRLVAAPYVRFEELQRAGVMVFADVQRSPKYIRIVTVSYGTQRAYGFIRKSDGAILYAAGWTRPFIGKDGPDAPSTVRGNIFDQSTWADCLSPYGVTTLNRRVAAVAPTKR